MEARYINPTKKEVKACGKDGWCKAFDVLYYNDILVTIVYEKEDDCWWYKISYHGYKKQGSGIWEDVIGWVNFNLWEIFEEVKNNLARIDLDAELNQKKVEILLKRRKKKTNQEK